MSQQVLNFLYEIPVGGIDVQKHVGVVKDHIFMYVFNLYFDLVSYINTARFMHSEAAVNELTSCSSRQCNHLQGGSSSARRH